MYTKFQNSSINHVAANADGLQTFFFIFAEECLHQESSLCTNIIYTYNLTTMYLLIFKVFFRIKRIIFFFNKFHCNKNSETSLLELLLYIINVMTVVVQWYTMLMQTKKMMGR